MSKSHRKTQSDSKSSVKCVRDIRDFPPSSYRLPSDGRKWLAQARLRRELAIQMATHADGDGSSITAGVKRWAKALEVSERTIYRLLDDLRNLGPGFLLEKEGLTKENGTAIRRLDVSKLKMRGADLTDSVSDLSDSRKADLTDSQSRPDRLEGFGGSDLTRIGGRQPSDKYTDQPTQQVSVSVGSPRQDTDDPEGAWDTVRDCFAAWVGHPNGSLRPKDKEKWNALVQQCGKELVTDAALAWTKKNLESLKANPKFGLYLFMREPEDWIKAQHFLSASKEPAQRVSVELASESQGSQSAADERSVVEHHLQCASQRGMNCDCVAGHEQN